MVKALVITGFGINCEEEMSAAFQQAGAQATIVHLNEILQEKISIHDFDILSFPGGFSFVDDLASGKVMANKIKYKRLPSGGVLIDEIKSFKEHKLGGSIKQEDFNAKDTHLSNNAFLIGTFATYK